MWQWLKNVFTDVKRTFLYFHFKSRENSILFQVADMDYEQGDSFARFLVQNVFTFKIRTDRRKKEI